MTPNERQTRRATWLMVLNALPRPHQHRFFEGLRAMIKTHLGNDPDRERESRLLSSEIVMRMVAAASPLEADPTYPADLQGAGDDDRLGWLLQDVARGLIPLIPFIRKDIMRRDHGRAAEGGFRMVQPASLRQAGGAGNAESDDATLGRLQYERDPDDGERASRELYTARILQGIRACVQGNFGAGSDEGCLIGLLATDSDLQDEFDLYRDHQWPVARIAARLGEQFTNGPWTTERVDNARRNIRRWIERLKTTRGLTAPTDLQALFAAVARKLESPASLSSTRVDPGSALRRRPRQ